MNEEKILYHANKNGTFRISSNDYRGKVQQVIDKLLDNKFLNWETNELWAEYKSFEMTDSYNDAVHEYTITTDGKVLLSLYRLEYAHKHHFNEEKHINRINDFKQLLKESTKDSKYFEKFLNNSQKKALVYAQQVGELPDVSDMLVEPELDSSIELDPYKISHFHLGVSQERIDNIDLELPQLLSMFNMSVGLGSVKTNKTRTEDYVLRKTNEELGELTLEMNIADGLSYKEAGKDGVKGEAVDLAICAMDMFALQCPNMSPEEIEREFLAYMLVKLNKWRKTLTTQTK